MGSGFGVGCCLVRTIYGLDLLCVGLGVSGRFEVLEGSGAEWLLGLAAVEGRETKRTWAF